jgi:hypothetical protein
MMVQMRNHTERLDGSPGGRPVSCEEFQSKMVELLGGGIRDHQHLKTCERCRELLDDLEYIAIIAGDLLLPVHEPADVVWKNISKNIGASLPKSTEEAAKRNGHLAEEAAKLNGHLARSSPKREPRP